MVYSGGLADQRVDFTLKSGESSQYMVTFARDDQ